MRIFGVTNLRVRLRRSAGSLLVVALLLQSPIGGAVDCAAIYAQHERDDLTLSYETFDQSEGKGFRVLAQEGCDKEAADLIEAYIRTTRASQSSLRWHIAQLRASAGDSAAAIRYARSVLVEGEDYARNPLRWNDYVLATIAFLEHDRAALILHRDRVARAGNAYFGNTLNLKLLDSLIEHFDRDYKYATSHIQG